MHRSQIAVGIFLAALSAGNAQAGSITAIFTNAPLPAAGCGPVDAFDRCTNSLQHSAYLGPTVEEIDFQQPVVTGPAIPVPGTLTASGGSVVTFTSSGGGGSIEPGQFHTAVVSMAAAPWNNYTQFLSVPNSRQPSASGAVTLSFTEDHTYLGFNWGSVDLYNSIAFYNNGTLLQTFTGANAVGAANANGGQMSNASNGYIDFFLKDGWSYDEIRFISDNRAFEIDNVAFGDAVPAPMSAALLGLGLFGFARLRRRV